MALTGKTDRTAAAETAGDIYYERTANGRPYKNDDIFVGTTIGRPFVVPNASPHTNIEWENALKSPVPPDNMVTGKQMAEVAICISLNP
jgi:hypothetical protein